MSVLSSLQQPQTFLPLFQLFCSSPLRIFPDVWGWLVWGRRGMDNSSTAEILVGNTLAQLGGTAA